MTYYEYVGEMQELCFKVSQALKVLGECGLYTFYYAASKGYQFIREDLSCAEAGLDTTKDQLEVMESTAAYLKEVEKQACAKLDQEVTA